MVTKITGVVMTTNISFSKIFNVMALCSLAVLAGCQQSAQNGIGVGTDPGAVTYTDTSSIGTIDDGAIYTGVIDSLDSAYDTRIGNYAYDASAPAVAFDQATGVNQVNSTFVNPAPARTANFRAVSADGKTIYFDQDSVRVQQEALSAIERHAQALTSSGRQVTLFGHTDETGSAAYNQSLGERRNLSVARALASYGVPASQISTVSYGEEKPASFGRTEADYAQNRRVVISY
jgi:peptidoglycan-associated lipoprotein